MRSPPAGGSSAEIAPDTDPIALAASWLQAARDSLGDAAANAAALATVSQLDGAPNVRMVLLKQVDDESHPPDARGFLFCTPLESTKVKEIAASGTAALCMYWFSLGRQLRIRGRAARCSDATADAHWAAQSRRDQVSVWASAQSRVLERREDLPDARDAAEERFKGKDIPRPDDWGGIRIVPTMIEFWMNRPSKLHERVVFKRKDERSPWAREELQP